MPAPSAAGPYGGRRRAGPGIVTPLDSDVFASPPRDHPARGRSAATLTSNANEGARRFHQSIARRSPLARRTPGRSHPDRRVARHPRGQKRALDPNDAVPCVHVPRSGGSRDGGSASARVLHQAPDRPADALVRAMGRHRTAGAGSGSSRTPLIHPAPFRAPRILLVVIGRRSASASASPSRATSKIGAQGVVLEIAISMSQFRFLPSIAYQPGPMSQVHVAFTEARLSFGGPTRRVGARLIRDGS